MTARTQDTVTGWCRQALRFVLPVQCASCGVRLGSDPVPLFCRDCWARIVPLKGPSCACCDQPFVSPAATSFTPHQHCANCLDHPPVYWKAWTLFPYLPPLQQAICLLKYQGKICLANPLARLMATVLPADLQADVIVPVPLHPARLRTREFNQSLLLADHLGRQTGKAVLSTSLIRIRATDPQMTLPRRERLGNLRKAFVVSDPRSIADRRILLVDDVFTTGTTLNECAKVLLEAGAESVCAMTLARTVDTNLVPDRLFTETPSRSLSALGI